MTDTERALVLGGGGLAGIAWQTGVLLGLAEGGVAVHRADLVVGTSAGAAVGAQLGSGLSLPEMFDRQADPALHNPELAPEVDFSGAELLELTSTIGDRQQHAGQLRRRIGAMALDAHTVPEQRRRKIIEGRLPARDWPDQRLWLVAVEAHTGTPRVFDRDCGVDLVDAVAASCAVPGVWPTVEIDGARYMDGGVRSMTNVDLAHGYRRILLIAPLLEPSVAEQLNPEQTLLVTPDDSSVHAFGTDVLDPAVRAPAAHAGRAQGRRHAQSVAAHWN